MGKKDTAVVTLKEQRLATFPVTVEGTTTLIQHNWSEKAKQQLRDKHAGKKTKNREVRDPDDEFKRAMYLTADGKHGVPAMSIKSAMITAAHKDLGIEKTLVRKAVRILVDDPGMVLEMDCCEPRMVEDVVRVGMNQVDLRYRPYFDQWSVNFMVEIDEDLLTANDLFNLINRAGFGVGIGEWRPEKNGENGRFRVKGD